LAKNAKVFFYVSSFEPTMDVEGILWESDEAAWTEANIRAAAVLRTSTGTFDRGA
jgi:hypothetical protein